MSDWKIFQGNNHPHDGIGRLPEPPPWRDFATLGDIRGRTFQAGPREVELVNPLDVTLFVRPVGSAQPRSQETA